MNAETAALVRVPAAITLIATALHIREWRAADLIMLAGLEPFRRGTHKYYNRADLDAVIAREDAR